MNSLTHPLLTIHVACPPSFVDVQSLMATDATDELQRSRVCRTASRPLDLPLDLSTFRKLGRGPTLSLHWCLNWTINDLTYGQSLGISMCSCGVVGVMRILGLCVCVGACFPLEKPSTHMFAHFHLPLPCATHEHHMVQPN